MPHSLPPPEPIDVAAEIRTIRHELHELRDRQSLRKNGHTWKQYVAKWVTPQNILIAMLALVQFGGRIQEMQTSVADALRGNSDVVQDIAEIIQKLDERGRTLQALQRQQDALQMQSEMFATKTDLVNVRESVTQTVIQNVTRAEFRDAINRQIMPRLERIERKMDAR